MHVELKMQGLDSVRDELATLSGPVMRGAYADALNDTGGKLQREMRADIGSIFDRPTDWVKNSPWVNKATADKLSLSVLPTRRRDAATSGGKMGVDPQYILQAQEFGGRRADKKSEILLRRAGILPNGFQTAIPDQPFPGSEDGQGNLRGAFVQQLLSYLQTFGEQGYSANMKPRRKAQIHKGTAKAAGRRYFVAYGRLRDGRASHLPPGIWAASGTHGVNLQPVLMFVRTGNYTPRLSMERISERGLDQEYFEKRLRYRIRLAAGV